MKQFLTAAVGSYGKSVDMFMGLDASVKPEKHAGTIFLQLRNMQLLNTLNV